MKKIIENKSSLILLLEIIVIILGLISITLATSKLLNNRSQAVYKISNFEIDYKGDMEVNANNLQPINDDKIEYDTKENVVRVEFSLRGSSKNKNEDLIYDVMIKDMNIDCSLLNEYTKWKMYKNGNLISSGSLDPKFDGDVLGDSMRLTNIQEDLPKYNQEYDNYVLLFWISESCNDLEKCNLVDQSNIINSSMSMKIFIALYGGDKKEIKRVPNYDTSCANKPILYNNMVAVTYKNGNFVVANSDNSSSDNLWYDYGNQKWANAVVVKNNKYTEEGMTISNEDILGYYVWIPRFRYKLWNVEDTITDSYQAYDNGIDIVFESGLGSINNKEYKNNSYITHPAFNDSMTGFWVSKYEISKENDEYLFVPNKESYHDDEFSNYIDINNSIANNYSLGDKVESHVINNLEWGSILYLTHSKYGVCKNDGCLVISPNDSYISGNNKQDVTTRNVYGVYDMAGGAIEYVSGNNSIGSATSELELSNGLLWNDTSSYIYDGEYLLRGGRGLYYCTGLGMGIPKISSRGVLVSK